MNTAWKWPMLFSMGLAMVAIAWTFAQAAEDAAPTAAEPRQPATAPSDFTYELPRAGLTSAGVFDADGKLVRTLWRTTSQPAGKHSETWDGMTDFKQPAAPGKYEVRVVLNNGTYTNVANIGNTGQPPDDHGHLQGNAPDMTVDANGRIYTANGWDEAGHDFKVFNPDGTTAFHARYQIRNGNPNGAPYSIAVDDKFIYCGMGGWAHEPWNSKQQLQRFTIENGNHTTFTDESLKDSAGHIQLYEWPERQIPETVAPADVGMMHAPLRAVAIRGDELLCADVLGNKIHRFHKVTGKKLGEFNVALPHALAVDDARGLIFVGHEHSKVSIFDGDGKLLKTPITDAKFVQAIKFCPRGTRLILTDSGANQVRVYREMIPGHRLAVPAYGAPTIFGGPAKPGDDQPDRFYKLQCAVMDHEGNLIVSQSFPAAGFRLTKFAAGEAKDENAKLFSVPTTKVVWDHMGLEFCSVGNYAAYRPDEVITQRMHRIAIDRKNSTWTYKGTVLQSDPKYIDHQHGVPRILKIGQNEFFFQAYGDGMQAYRRDSDGLLRLSAMVGGINPRPDGTWNDFVPPEKKTGMGQWTWSDANGDGVVDEKEINTFKEFGQGQYSVLGMNVDMQGNILYCDHHTWGIHELPRTGVDAKGNPTWDWAKGRQLVERDETPAKFFPLMAVRAEDGSIYALGRPEEGSVFERANRQIDGWVWMGGELMAKFDKTGQRQWVIRMPKKCNGIDVIPGGGAATGFFEDGETYHVSPDGLVIGSVKPGDPSGNQTGWLDNTSAVVANRGPDGVIDLFIEDSYLHRFLWHRIDDKNIQTINVAVERK